MDEATETTEPKLEPATPIETFADLVADWLVAHDCATPASIPATDVEAMRAQAGL